MTNNYMIRFKIGAPDLHQPKATTTVFACKHDVYLANTILGQGAAGKYSQLFNT